MAVMFCQKCGSNVKMPHRDCPNEFKPVIVYVLVYNEWDGGSGDISENVIASYNKDKIEAYKKDIEEKSVDIRNELMKLEDESEKKLKSLWDEYRPIIQQKKTYDWRWMKDEDRKPILEREKEILKQIGLVNGEAYKKQHDYLESFNLSHYIDDPETCSLTLEEIHLI